MTQTLVSTQNVLHITVLVFVWFVGLWLHFRAVFWVFAEVYLPALCVPDRCVLAGSCDADS